MKNRLLLISSILFAFLQNNFSGIANTLQDGYYEAKLATSVPVIDGVGDDACWAIADWAPINQVWIGAAVPANDYSGKFKVVWTKDRLYLLVEIIDDSLRCQAADVSSVCNNIYNYDCVEIFIDENNSRETNYSGTYKAFAYHFDTAGHICNNGVRLDGNINYKMKRVSNHTYDWEFEIKVFDDKFVAGGNNIPDTLTDGKLMGWSLAYNDNDFGNTRQNMIGSVFIAGNTDNERNISYFNSSVFGKLKLISGDSTNVSIQKIENSFQCNVNFTNHIIKVSYLNPANENSNIQLFDIFGREIEKIVVEKTPGFIEKELNVPELPKGIYLIKISNLNSQVTKKIIIR
jgi:hypothetical protein